MVYVIDKNGNPLMPTNEAKARKLLKSKKAIVKELKPFTIQLDYETPSYKQDITLGVDSGYLNIGFSAITEKKELLTGEVELLKGMKERLAEKSMYRRLRRSRLRYRKPRWNNRTRPEGWLAPSIQHKLDSHLRFIEKINKILPIKETIIEVANFDIQKIQNPDIEGVGYQQGDMLGFWNLREYILHRDNHKCQNPNCKNKVKTPILEIHHIVYRSEGGTDTTKNLITLCNKCHTPANHKKGKFLHEWLTNGKKVKQFKDATFMNLVRWKLLNQLKELYPNVSHTYGFITKNNRIKHKITKSHANDAFIIARGSTQERNKEIFNVEQVRRNNRSLEKFYDKKVIDTRTGKVVKGSELSCGRTTRNKNHNTENLRKYRGKTVSKGQRRIRTQRYFYQPKDLVRYEGKVYTSGGCSNKGKYLVLKELGKQVRVDKISPYKFQKGFVFTRRA